MNTLALILLLRLASNPTVFAQAHQLRGRSTTTTLTTNGSPNVGFRVLASTKNMAKVTTAGGAASNKEYLAFINDDVMILNKVEAPSVVIVPSDGTPPSDMPASAPAPAPMAALLSISNGTPTTMFPPTPEPTRPPSHSYLEWARIATEAPSILTNKAGTMTSPMIASNASVLNAFNTIAPSTSVVTKNSTTTNTTTATAPTCASSISYLYKEAELVTHCNKNSDCAGWTEDGPGCCLYPHCICGPKNVGGSATVSCLAY